MTLYIYSNETAEVVEKVTGGTQQEQMDYADSNYDCAEYGWTYSPEWNEANGLIDTGDAKETNLAAKEVRDFELLFDNGGGTLLLTPDYCHSYDRPDWAAADVAALLNGADPSDWDGNEPEFRRDRHAEDDVMTADMARAIYAERGAWPERGAAWDQFCTALAVQEVR